MTEVFITSFYHFKEIVEVNSLRTKSLEYCTNIDLLGTILISKEGINGSISGKKVSILKYFDWLQRELNLNYKIAERARWNKSNQPPFRRMRVKIKREIVALGRQDIKPFEKAGNSVKPSEWNKLILNPDVTIIDTRNEYEIEIGSFPNAVNPKTKTFREFPDFIKNISIENKLKPIAMFCTGGIRCEKAAALMIEMGFEDINQLEGGILNYLEEIDDKDNLWQGECFVFDDRVAVDNELSDGNYIQCHACRNPLALDEIQSEDYIEGISCPKCIDKISEDRMQRFRERQKQIDLAKKRGEKHIGKIIK